MSTCILTARLDANGVRSPEFLMVGDLLDNDIEPALAHGWQAWYLTPRQHATTTSGNWRELLAWMTETE